MKVAQVSLRFDAPGGVETNVREVAKGLRAAGDDVTVFASDLYDEGRWERRTNWSPTVDGLPVRRFPVERRVVPFVTMPLMGGLIDALSGGRFDVLHAHSHRYGHVLETAAVARRRHIPLVVSTHYHPADRGEPALKRGLLRCQDVLFGMTAYRIASALVVETALEAELVREFAPAAAIRVIPPGVDLDLWERPGPESPPVGLPARYLLYSGRVARNKGLPTLFAAFAGIPPADRPALVVMGRDWGERASLERLAAELGIGASVVWLGHVESPAEYRAVVRGAMLFVLPSEWEAFGLVLLEAMAAGVPVVASAVGGVPEVVCEGKAGRLVPYGDAAALTRAIQGLLADEGERARLIAAGRSRVQELTWAKAVEHHRALYRELTVG
ncbi:MAG: glycosyltransferase family 4 protein [Thermoplasmata archaeon]|nr:glycosyltransferase family 4 protein [Thermoplasmata archaeon]MCI4356603.1 glycosyltransferase family 4 protein [Thermoplasmata archaeon]